MHLYLRKTWSAKSRDYRGVIVFKKIRFRDGLPLTVCLTVEIKLRFLISPAYCGRDVRLFFWDQPFQD